MYKKLFVSVLCIITAFLSAQEPNNFNDVVEVGNFFERQLKKENKINPDVGVLFYDYQLNKNLPVSPAGILYSSVKRAKKIPKRIDTLKRLRKIDLNNTMMHEIVVLPHILVKAMEEVFVSSKIDKKEELENSLEFMREHEQSKYRQYLHYVIKSFQSQRILNSQIDKDLKHYLGIKDRPALKINARSCMHYIVLFFMLYKFFV